MIRLALVINYIAQNGTSSVVLHIIRNLDLSEFDVTLITLFQENDVELVADLRQHNIAVYECKTLSRRSCMLGNNREFAEYIANGHYDVIHSHGFVPDILVARLSTDAFKISTVHNNMFEDYIASYGLLNSVMMIPLHMAALKKMAVCVCCSHSVYSVMRKKLKNAICINNGVDRSQAAHCVTKQELGIPEYARVFIYVGWLSRGKRIRQLIKEFKLAHKENEYLLIIGEGAEEQACRLLADEHILVLGNQKDTGAYLAISDVYTSASMTEGFSISILEALSHGLKLLLSDIPSHREVLSGCDTYLGELYAQGQYEQAMRRLRTKWSTDTKERISNVQMACYSGAEMTRQYATLYCKRKRSAVAES